MDIRGQLHSSAALPPDSGSWYRSDRRLGGSRADMNMVAKKEIYSPAGNRPHVVQHIASHFRPVLPELNRVGCPVELCCSIVFVMSLVEFPHLSHA